MCYSFGRYLSLHHCECILVPLSSQWVFLRWHLFALLFSTCSFLLCTSYATSMLQYSPSFKLQIVLEDSTAFKWIKSKTIRFNPHNGILFFRYEGALVGVVIVINWSRCKYGQFIWQSLTNKKAKYKGEFRPDLSEFNIIKTRSHCTSIILITRFPFFICGGERGN